MNARAAVSVFASLLSACGGGGHSSDASMLACGAGTHLANGACVPDAMDSGVMTTCGPETQAVDGACVATSPTLGPDGGFTDMTSWAASVLVADPSAAETAEPQIVLDASGAIDVAYMQTDTAGSPVWSIVLSRSTDHGATFQVVTHFDPPSGRTFVHPTVAIDAANRVYVAWSSQTLGNFTAVHADVLVATSTDGTTFGAPATINAANTQFPFNDRPWFARTTSGSIVASWEYGTGAYPTPTSGALMASATNGTFGAAATVAMADTTSMLVEESPIAFATAGSGVLVGVASGGDMFNPQENIVALVQNASAWSTGMVASLYDERHFMFDTSPVVTTNGQGTMVAIFLDGDSRTFVPYVAVSTDDGAHWQPSAALEPSPTVAAEAAIPWITCDEHGTFHALWLDNRYMSWAPFSSSSSDGAHWSTAERVGDALFTEDGSLVTWIGDSLSLVVQGGTRYAAWTDSRTGTSQVRLATSPVH